MPSEGPTVESPPDSADLAKAFQELAKGERTAAAMENQLTALERKIDDLLASVDEQGRDVKTEQDASEDSSTDEHQNAKT